jgi:hypothetical protein
MSSNHSASRRHALTAAAVLLTGCTAPELLTWRLEPNYRVSSTVASAAQGYMALARQYEGELRWPEARDAWRKAAQAAPQDASILNELGMAEARQGQYGNAVAALRRAVALEPERAQLLNNLGYALLHDGRHEDAKAALQQALIHNPEHRQARANLLKIEPASELLAVRPPVTASANPAVPPPPLLPAFETLHVQTLPNLAPLHMRTAYSPLPALVISAAPNEPISQAMPMAPTGSDMPPDAWLAAKPRVDIANGNGITGMATQLRNWISGQGIAQRARLSNARPFNTAVTVVHYRVGYGAAAKTLVERMPQPVVLASAPGETLNADIRVVLGHDLRSLKANAFALPAGHIAQLKPVTGSATP